MTDEELIKLFMLGTISNETLLKHFNMPVEYLENKEKSAEKLDEYDFMFLEID